MWAWEPEKHGVYSVVRSAYRLLDARRIGDNGVNLSSVLENEIWKKIWRLKVPPKIRVFWWRVIHEFLPTRQILQHRHVEPTAFCEVYGADEESIKHILTKCTVARAFWRQAKNLTGVRLPVLHTMTWAQDLLCGRAGSEQNQVIIIIGMYSLWMQRNRRRHGEQSLPIRAAVQWVADMAFDLWQLTQPPKVVLAPMPAQTWKRPPPGWTKCNSSGAFYEHWKASGAVLRNANGDFVWGCAK